jgi:hypothetical protein
MVAAVRYRASTLIPLLLVIGAIIASFLASSGPIQWMDNGVFLADASEGVYFSKTLGPLDHPRCTCTSPPRSMRVSAPMC